LQWSSARLKRKSAGSSTGRGGTRARSALLGWF
jgi:hypothetical protein